MVAIARICAGKAVPFTGRTNVARAASSFAAPQAPHWPAWIARRPHVQPSKRCSQVAAQPGCSAAVCHSRSHGLMTHWLQPSIGQPPLLPGLTGVVETEQRVRAWPTSRHGMQISTVNMPSSVPAWRHAFARQCSLP